MTKQRIKYWLPDHGMSEDDAFSCEVNAYLDADMKAEEAAEDYHDNHDGWEANWPLTIKIADSESHLGTFEVDREARPYFSARELKKGV